MVVLLFDDFTSLTREQLAKTTNRELILIPELHQPK